MPGSFNAFVLHKDGSGLSAGVQPLTPDDLPAGDVTEILTESISREIGLDETGEATAGIPAGAAKGRTAVRL